MARITTSQREMKKQVILEEAEALLEDVSYHDVTLEMIAGKAGMTKSNLYHYFSSKEELYQEVLLINIGITVSSIEARLWELKGSDHVEDVSEVLADAISRKKGVNEIGALSNNLLTRNLSDENLKRFQEQFRNAQLMLTKALLVALPSLDVFMVDRFIDFFLAFKNGLWAEHAASAKYKEICSAIGSYSEEKEYKERLKEGTILLLRGLLAESRG